MDNCIRCNNPLDFLSYEEGTTLKIEKHYFCLESGYGSIFDSIYNRIILPNGRVSWHDLESSELLEYLHQLFPYLVEGDNVIEYNPVTDRRTNLAVCNPVTDRRTNPSVCDNCMKDMIKNKQLLMNIADDSQITFPCYTNCCQTFCVEHVDFRDTKKYLAPTLCKTENGESLNLYLAKRKKNWPYYSKFIIDYYQYNFQKPYSNTYYKFIYKSKEDFPFPYNCFSNCIICENCFKQIKHKFQISSPKFDEYNSTEQQSTTKVKDLTDFFYGIKPCYYPELLKIHEIQLSTTDDNLEMHELTKYDIGSLRYLNNNLDNWTEDEYMKRDMIELSTANSVKDHYVNMLKIGKELSQYILRRNLNILLKFSKFKPNHILNKDICNLILRF